jgi:trehalose 6-phosphate synthase/phosphatase
MGKIHIISNRLPYNIKEKGKGFVLEPSIGGLATGMKSIYENYDGRWIGWSGIIKGNIKSDKIQQIDELLAKENCKSLYLSADEVSLFYEGFSNDTLWPLFHYFAQYAEFRPEFWKAYKAVNCKFAEAALEILEDGDTIWVHDYHLLLVPQMIKLKKPNVNIGFFLHIPFPSFEVLRVLPWRKKLIGGMLGADLIGFHIYDYQRHFLSTVRRLFGYEISFNQIHVEDRIVVADAFPMGIDYHKFSDAATHAHQKVIQERSSLHINLEKYFVMAPGRKLVLSIDRMDYTKGIPNRLRGFCRFLDSHPEFRNKVTLVMLAVPSRTEVERYQLLKKEVDELVGRINGKYGNVNYTPIWYFYRSLPFENLIELYSLCDVALVTPVRDGMNLVAKEYVASRTNRSGVLILSEMAGAAKELGEAIIINPNDVEAIAKSIYQSLKMPLDEQRKRMSLLQHRIKRYDVFKWSDDFVKTLERTRKIQEDYHSKKITPSILDNLHKRYLKSNKRAIFLDYDGTLTHFKKDPRSASPDKELHAILSSLESDRENSVILISGRDRKTLETWMKGHRLNLVCEHGVWLKRVEKKWEMLANISNSWMEKVRPVIERFVDRTPGSFIEEKNYSLVWHYRKSEPEQGELRAHELNAALMDLVSNHNLEIMEGSKVIEVKNAGINKGIAVLNFLKDDEYNFIMAIGDDWTDEYMFRELPDDAVSVKVGITHTNADYNLGSVNDVRDLLKSLIDLTP